MPPRRETLALPAWTRQAEQDAGDRVPVVVYCRSREPWRASLPFDKLARLLAIEATYYRTLGDTCACFTIEDGFRPCPTTLCERSDHEHA